MMDADWRFSLCRRAFLNLGQWYIAATSRQATPRIESPTGALTFPPRSLAIHTLPGLPFLARLCKKAPSFEGTDNVSMSLYAVDRNAVEKSVSCAIHRASAAYRPYPPLSAHFEH